MSRDLQKEEGQPMSQAEGTAGARALWQDLGREQRFGEPRL